MRGESHKQKQRTTQHAQQQLLLRALVGSLVFYAAFATTSNALAQNLTTEIRPQTSNQDSPLSYNDIERIKNSFTQGLRDIRQEVKASGSNPEKFNLTVTLFNGSLETDYVGDDRWSRPIEVFINTIQISRTLSGLTQTPKAAALRVSLKADEQKAFASVIANFDTEEQTSRSFQNVQYLLSLARASAQDKDVLDALNNMTFSANGKQLVMKLEMSREQAGNLLRKQLALP